MIPFLSFEHINKQIKEEILQSFEKFFDGAWYILGDELKRFEAAYASYCGTAHCIGVSNGLDALHLALRTLDIGAGDEVLVPSNSFIASFLAVTQAGARPVPVEPDSRTYNIDPAKMEEAITPLTRAIMPVHLYGQACEMEAVMAVAAKHNLYVVEDNAQAQGALHAGRTTGGWGHINGTSFYPGKNLGAFGDAGALTTNDPQLAQKAMALRNYGSQEKYRHELAGFNMRLDECQAGFLSVKLKYLPQWTRQRQEVAALYQQALEDVGDIILPYTHPHSTHVYHLYVIRTPQRDRLQRYLSEHGIGTLIHYPVPPHLQTAYAHLQRKKGDLPLAEELATTCLSLPVWPGLRENDIGQISTTIKKFYSEAYHKTEKGHW